MSSPVLQVEGLSKTYIRKFGLFKRRVEEYKAVDNISFDLKEGEILGLLGANGAGKTTTIKMLLAILSPTSGSITYFGKNFKTHRSEILKSVCHASAYHRFPGLLSVEQNLEIYARLSGLNYQEASLRITQFLDFFEIPQVRHKRAITLSAGQMTRVMLAKAFMSHPKIVLLDEPTASLDPDIAKQVRSFILNQQKEYGVSVILTSHNMLEVAEMCERVMVMQKGVIVEEDTPEKLSKKISLSTISMIITANRMAATDFLKNAKISFTLVDNQLNMQIDETFISQLLIELAKRDVQYSHIELGKPTLEDYFLKITQESRI